MGDRAWEFGRCFLQRWQLLRKLPRDSYPPELLLTQLLDFGFGSSSASLPFESYPSTSLVCPVHLERDWTMLLPFVLSDSPIPGFWIS